MAHALPLGAEVVDVLGVGRGLERYPPGDLQTEAFEAAPEGATHVLHRYLNPAKDLRSQLLRILRKDQKRYAEKHLPGWQKGVMRAAGAVRGWLGGEAE